MSDDLDADLELKNLRNELLKDLNKKTLNPKKKYGEKNTSSEDDELELLRLQALKTKHYKTDNKNKRNENLKYEVEFEGREESKKSITGDASKSRQFQDEFKNKYQRYRDRCTRIMSNEAYEPDMISYNLKETLNNLDLRRLLKEKLEESESSNDPNNTDLILHQLDHAYRPITEPISLTKNDFYNGETKYWKNNNNFSKHKSNDDSTYMGQDTDSSIDDEEDDYKPSKKLRSIVQVINTTNKDEAINSSNHYHSSYRRRRRYDSNSSR